MFSLLARGSRNEVGASDLTRLGVGAPRIRLSDLIPTSPHLGGLRPLYPAIDLWVVPLRGDVEVASYTSFIESSDHATSRWTWIDMTPAVAVPTPPKVMSQESIPVTAVIGSACARCLRPTPGPHLSAPRRSRVRRTGLRPPNCLTWSAPARPYRCSADQSLDHHKASPAVVGLSSTVMPPPRGARRSSAAYACLVIVGVMV